MHSQSHMWRVEMGLEWLLVGHTEAPTSIDVKLQGGHQGAFEQRRFYLARAA